jgi:hypothetical protein
MTAMPNQLEYRLAERLLDEKDYAALESSLADADLPKLAGLWPQFTQLHKLILFKLMDAPRALELYGLLPFKEKYFLLCGFPLNSIAPVLEALSPLERRHFVQLPREFYDRMFRQLVPSRVEMDLTLRNN